MMIFIMACQLLWHVQNLLQNTTLQWSNTETNFPLNLKYDGKIIHEMVPGSVDVWLTSWAGTRGILAAGVPGRGKNWLMNKLANL